MILSGELAEATVAVAVCDGGRSRRAVRWAARNLIPHAYRVLLLHVIPTVSFIPSPSGRRIPVEGMEKGVVDLFVEDVKAKAEEVFLPFQKLCRTKNVETLLMYGTSTEDVILKYMRDSGIRNLVLGSSSMGWIRRMLKGPDVPARALKSAPSSFNIFVVSRCKVTLKFGNHLLSDGSSISIQPKRISRKSFCPTEWNCISKKQSSSKSSEIHDLLIAPSDVDTNSDISGNFERTLSLSSVGIGEESKVDGRNTIVNKFEKLDASVTDILFLNLPSADNVNREAPAEVTRVKLDVQKTLALYKQTCKDLLRAKKKVELLTDECSTEKKKVYVAEGAKHLEAIKEVEETRQLVGHKAEKLARKFTFVKSNALDDLFSSNKRFRRYSRHEIETATDNFSDSRKIGEGAYGCVYMCNIDHIPVAVKVVWQDASDKKEEFLREVEVLSQLHHPHMVALLGVCPESGCLVYEYMENGSLEDQLFNRENSPPLPWFIRFRIIFEVACALAFLHGNKPDPIVHRDLKPGNILLDKNFVSKVGDVGLAKLISDIVPDSITEYKETILAGTWYYMDPEYQRTGTIRPKSDLYALGLIALQLLTGMQVRGLIIQVENAIEDRTFADILDKSVSDWPLIEAEKLAKIALKCSRLRCRDRPDLESEVLPELEELLNMANVCLKLKQYNVCAPGHYLCPILQEVMDDPYIAADGYTYELRAIKAWLDRHKVSPVTRLELPHPEVIPNHSLRVAIQEWKSRVSFSM
ncbi:hypothetical protein KFK09_003633 [Dendrobium nobile]|uniref:RING-type E3 ubiquitin transferase n=1 Tax=Dendrobium nobile TaxID=94219 RepID=A0A8T3C3K4_DENNO|nr:hypothetical protein KFK09_003633 [Dendrobium nobile]